MVFPRFLLNGINAIISKHYGAVPKNHNKKKKKEKEIESERER